MNEAKCMPLCPMVKVAMGSEEATAKESRHAGL